VLLTATPPSAPRSLSPTRIAQPVSQMSQASFSSNQRAQQIASTPVTARHAAPAGRSSNLCTMCGSMCMDGTSLCRRCTLNSQRSGSSVQRDCVRVSRTSSLSPVSTPPRLTASHDISFSHVATSMISPSLSPVARTAE
jgi:hypothetical protein